MIGPASGTVNDGSIPAMQAPVKIFENLTFDQFRAM